MVSQAARALFALFGASCRAAPGHAEELEAGDHGRSLRWSASPDPKTMELKTGAGSAEAILALKDVEHHIPMPSGSWLLDESKSFAAPTCCDKDWHRREIPPPECKAAAGTVMSVGQNGCNDSGLCGNFREEYTWSGVLSPWDPNDACRLLGGRSVLMIGDSTMNQAAITLSNALYPAGCSYQIKYRLADTLIGERMYVKNRGGHWLDYVKDYAPDIILVTAGAHIYGRENFDRVLEAVVNGTKMLKESNPNLQVVWKTQQPGGCTHNILTPEDDIPTWERYNYDEFFERDMYALSVLPQSGIHVLDMRMLYYRSDAHIDSKEEEQIDCLHMCNPGPLDIIADLFWKLLQSLDGHDALSDNGVLVQ